MRWSREQFLYFVMDPAGLESEARDQSQQLSSESEKVLKIFAVDLVNITLGTTRKEFNTSSLPKGRNF